MNIISFLFLSPIFPLLLVIFGLWLWFNGATAKIRGWGLLMFTVMLCGFALEVVGR